MLVQRPRRVGATQRGEEGTLRPALPLGGALPHPNMHRALTGRSVASLWTTAKGTGGAASDESSKGGAAAEEAAPGHSNVSLEL